MSRVPRIKSLKQEVLDLQEEARLAGANQSLHNIIHKKYSQKRKGLIPTIKDYQSRPKSNENDYQLDKLFEQIEDAWEAEKYEHAAIIWARRAEEARKAERFRKIAIAKAAIAKQQQRKQSFDRWQFGTPAQWAKGRRLTKARIKKATLPKTPIRKRPFYVPKQIQARINAEAKKRRFDKINEIRFQARKASYAKRPFRTPALYAKRWQL